MGSLTFLIAAIRGKHRASSAYHEVHLDELEKRREEFAEPCQHLQTVPSSQRADMGESRKL